MGPRGVCGCYTFAESKRFGRLLRLHSYEPIASYVFAGVALGKLHIDYVVLCEQMRGASSVSVLS